MRPPQRGCDQHARSGRPHLMTRSAAVISPAAPLSRSFLSRRRSPRLTKPPIFMILLDGRAYSRSFLSRRRSPRLTKLDKKAQMPFYIPLLRKTAIKMGEPHLPQRSSLIYPSPRASFTQETSLHLPKKKVLTPFARVLYTSHTAKRRSKTPGSGAARRAKAR